MARKFFSGVHCCAGFTARPCHCMSKDSLIPCDSWEHLWMFYPHLRAVCAVAAVLPVSSAILWEFSAVYLGVRVDCSDSSGSTVQHSLQTLCSEADFIFSKPLFSLLLSPQNDIPHHLSPTPLPFPPSLHQALELTHRCRSVPIGLVGGGGLCWLNDIGSLATPLGIYCKSLPLNDNTVVGSPHILPQPSLATCRMFCGFITSLQHHPWPARRSFSFFLSYLTCSTRKGG